MDARKKLLLVDDDPALLKTLRDFLDFEGYAVTCASSGEEALVAMRHDDFDLVILDMSMPGMGGTGFLERITDADGNISLPVLVLTARSMMAEFFADKSIAGFLAKPSAPEDLLAEINRILFENSGDASRTQCARRSAVVADDDIVFLQQLQDELNRAGIDAIPVSGGGQAIESCIINHPDILVMRMRQSGMCADEVISMLRRLPAGNRLVIVVYDVNEQSAGLDNIARLELPETHVVGSCDLNRIVDRVLSLAGGNR